MGHCWAEPAVFSMSCCLFFPSSPQSPGWILGLSELPDLPRGCLVAHTGLLGEHMKKGKFEKQKHISCDLFFVCFNALLMREMCQNVSTGNFIKND